MNPRRAKRKAKAEEQAERLMQAGETLAATGKRLNEDPRLLAIVRSLRSVLPGDSDAAASLAKGGDGQPRAVGKAVADLTSKRPGVLGEAGLGAIQVWSRSQRRRAAARARPSWRSPSPTSSTSPTGRWKPATRRRSSCCATSASRSSPRSSPTAARS